MLVPVVGMVTPFEGCDPKLRPARGGVIGRSPLRLRGELRIRSAARRVTYSAHQLGLGRVLQHEAGGAGGERLPRRGGIAEEHLQPGAHHRVIVGEHERDRAGVLLDGSTLLRLTSQRRSSSAPQTMNGNGSTIST